MSTPTLSPTQAADAIVAALFRLGPPSTLTLDPDSVRDVAAHVAVACDRARQTIGADRARLDATKAAVRAGVAARSTDAYDLGRANVVCRVLHRSWMVATIRRHPRADRFGSLIFALQTGHYTRAQQTLALSLVAEVAS